MISIILGSGFEEIEAITVFDILKRAGADVLLVSVTGTLEVSSARNLVLKADYLIDDIKDKKHQMVVIPGGMAGVRRIINSPSAKLFLQKIYMDKTKIGAICAGPLVLDKFGLFSDETKYTCYPGVEEEIVAGHFVNENIVVDGQFITSVAPGTASEFAFELVETLYDKNIMMKVRKSWFGKRDED